MVNHAFELKVARKVKGVHFTEEQTVILDNVIRYFIGDPTSIYALHKGLFVYGKFGVGKTILFDVIQELCVCTPVDEMKFNETPSKRYVKDYVDYREGKIKTDPSKKILVGHLLLNDLGEEQKEIHNYKNVINPIGDLLSERNIGFDQYGYKTHATSNLGLTDEENDEEFLIRQLEEMYGSRILDRFYDQFETIEIPGDSKRG